MQRKILLVLFALVLLCPAKLAQQAKPNQTPEIADVIRRFAAAESENKVARNNYTFTQDFDLLTVGEAGSTTGRFHRISDVVFDDRGNRIERITFFPAPTLTQLTITSEDMQDLSGVQPFALTTEDLPKYQVDYHGKEKVDELTTYVFDVKPKAFRKGERYLQGRIWVDDHDLQIVKVAGQAVPEIGEQKFPHFESYRENIDARYWFPTYIYADDMLVFKKGPSIHLRMTVRFTNYKKFSGRIKVIDEGEAASDEDAKSPDKPKPAPKKPPESQPPTDPVLKRPNKPPVN
jgi:hypothetical protein